MFADSDDQLDDLFAISDDELMNFVIETAALKALLRMPKDDAEGLRAKLKTFAANPYGPHAWAKAFGGGRGRIRHGDWRAVFEIDGPALVITVLKVGNRERGLPMNALPIRPIAETADSVTLSRADFETLAELVSDAQDLTDADAVKARLAAGETETFPFAVAERLLDGEHPVTVLREHRAFTVRGLAEVAGVSPSYLSEIELGKKPGSFDAMARVAAALEVPLDLLVRA